MEKSNSNQTKMIRSDYRVHILKNGIRIRFEDRGRMVNHFFGKKQISDPEKLLSVIFNLSSHVWCDRSLIHSFLWLASQGLSVSAGTPEAPPARV